MSLGRRQYYDAEPWYLREGKGDWYQQMQATNQAMVEILGRYLGTQAHILEVACGGGWLSEHILSKGVESYRGFDFAESAVEHARERLGPYGQNIYRADAMDPASYSQVSLLIAHQFFHCLVGEDRPRWLKICRSHLSGGQLLLSSMIGLPPALVGEIDPITRVNKPGNRYYAEDEEIQAELKNAGFELIEVLYPEPYSAIYLAE